MDVVCPFATYMPVSANTGPAMSADIRGFVPHSQVGYGSLFTTFNNPSRKASTNCWISKGGGIEQYVPLNIQAWAHGPGNPYFWSSEFEGLSSEPLTSPQIDSGGRLIAWMYEQHSFPLVINRVGVSGRGITPHRDLMATNCPGDIRLAQYNELILAALRYLPHQPIPGDIPVEVIIKPANDQAQYLINTASGLVAPIPDASAAEELIKLGTPRINYAQQSWDKLYVALRQVCLGQ